MTILTWTRVRHYLNIFKEIGGNKFLIGIPILSIIFISLMEALDLHWHAPVAIFLIFLAALPFGLAEIVYSSFCPQSIRDFTDEEDWHRRSMTDRRRLIEAIETDNTLRNSLSSMMDTNLPQIVDSIKNNPPFPDHIKSIIVSEFKARLMDNLLVPQQDIKSVYETTFENFLVLNSSKTNLRLLCSVLIIASVVLVSIEVMDRISEVSEFVFGVHLWSVFSKFFEHLW